MNEPHSPIFLNCLILNSPFYLQLKWDEYNGLATTMGITQAPVFIFFYDGGRIGRPHPVLDGDTEEVKRINDAAIEFVKFAKLDETKFYVAFFPKSPSPADNQQFITKLEYFKKLGHLDYKVVRFRKF